MKLDWQKTLVGTLGAWLSLLGFLGFFIAEQVIVTRSPFGYGPWPQSLPLPRFIEGAVLRRNVSFLVVLIAGSIAIRRWQAKVGMSLTLAYFAYSYWMLATY